jgi:hypothetical protein
MMTKKAEVGLGIMIHLLPKANGNVPEKAAPDLSPETAETIYVCSGEPACFPDLANNPMQKYCQFWKFLTL